MSRSDESKTLSISEIHHDDQPLALVVLGEGYVETHPMPRPGRLRIGRAETNEVRIDHSLISREHAVFLVSDQIELQDLGSRNGTFVRDQRLAPHERRVVEPGQLIQFGSTLCIIQKSRSTSTRHRLATHGALEHRLDELCRKSSRHDQHALFRIHPGDEVSPARMQRILSGLLGPQDLAACYAPGEYEVLLVDSRDRTDRVRDRLARELADPMLRLGIAIYPQHGTTADQLIETACAGALASSEERYDGPIILDGAMKDLYAVAKRVAQGNISVLLLGETGVGKEVLAEWIHHQSPRSDRPFVRLNCAALSESLLESELFGYEKGAFTGAQSSKMGLLESASGGTIMLDELGEMPLSTQAKLLRVLEQRQVLPVGGLVPRPIDVRFISATNRDLEKEVAKGTFRQDVFFRLNGVTLVVPPLRERTSEIEALAKRFVAHAAKELAIEPPPELSPRAMELILDYDWPGNIRELKNTMERAVLLADDTIEPEHLPHEKMSLPSPSQSEASMGDDPDDDERRRILEALEECAGNQTRAAKLLGIGRRTLTSKLTRYGIRRPRKKV